MKISCYYFAHGISAERTETTLTTAQPNSIYLIFLRTYLNTRARRQSERETVDARILEEALAGLALQHRAKLSVLDLELKEDENKVRSAFELERVSGW